MLSHRPGMTSPYLDANRARPYDQTMINIATILTVRRRRTIAVWAVVCV
jgi:predicted secreted protein